GGRFEGAPVLLLTTTGAKSGLDRTSPMMYLPEGQRVFVFASNAGSGSHPNWYHNLRADPTASVELGTETFTATATEITGAERDRLYAIQAQRYPGFAEYQAGTDRLIPVIELVRTPDAAG
ncbi:MAG TPA: nitroreductase/quinone reductase family protein, partial [Mycolicibacillus parakoreensis]|nr:nitroreductase/quinone reductase family protein [Mycolicibacillus parakoreensis]